MCNLMVAQTCSDCGTTSDSDDVRVAHRDGDGALCTDCYAERLAAETRLSERESEVWALVDDGLSQHEIADELGLKRGSVNSMYQRAKRKREEAAATLRWTGGGE